MGWDNLTKIAARSQINIIGRNLIVSFDNGDDDLFTKGILSTKMEKLKHSNFEVDDFSFHVSILKEKIKNPDDVISITFDGKKYEIVKYSFDIDGYFGFYLKESYA